MSATTLYFYQTGFKIEYNGVFEDLETYLSTLTPQEEISDFAYFKPTYELDRKIKINLSQSFYIGQILPWDYLKTVDSDTGSIKYWFITDIRWLAQNTVELSISLDTLNTYWSLILKSLNNETHITRRYKNRWTYDHTAGVINYFKPLVDDFPEQITQPILYKISEKIISGTTWYLIFKTDNSNASEVAENPISVYALPKTALFCKGTSTTPTLESDVVYYMTKGLNNGESLTFTSSSGSTLKLTLGDFNKSNNVVEWLYIANGYVFYQNTSGYISTDYRSSFAFKTFSASSTEVKIYPVKITADVATNITLIDPENYITCSSSSTVTQILQQFDSWYSKNKADTTIVKILELPYAPFELSYDKGVLVLPTGWAMSSVGLKLTTATTFKQTLSAEQPLMVTKILKSGKFNLEYETKLYNSSYYQIKYIFGDSYLNANLEHFTEPNQSFTITFYCSTEMSSNIAFRFDIDGMKYESDFGQWLSSNRDLEKPYYTNEYLNYLRYGKKYDEQALALNAGTSLINAGVNTVKQASTGFNPVGLITTAVSVGTSIMSATNSINQKIENYQHQSSKSSTINALSLFNAQTTNKLIRIIYQPVEEIKKSIANYFRLFGYACDEYAVPTFQNRRYSDYMVCEPSFTELYLPSIYIEDIRVRMRNGFRVYHYKNSIYDLHNEQENLEQNLNIPTTTSEEGGEN